MARKGKRPAPLSYRPPVAKREALLERVARSGLSVNAFITAAVFGQEAPHRRRSSPLAQQDAARLLAQAARIRDLLSALPSLTADGQAETLRACLEELVAIRTCLMEVMGRDP